MKIVKLTMLAATAAVAAMAFIGVSTASAHPPWIVVCLKAELLDCKNLAKHPLSGRVITLVGKGLFKAGFVNIECEKGEGNSTSINSQQEKVFTGELEKLTFEKSKCKGCTEVQVGTPQVVTLDMETETGGWKIHAKNARVKFDDCILGQECTYQGTLDLEVQMNATEAFVEPKGAQFKKVEGTGACAEFGKWESGKTLFDWELDNAIFPLGTRHLDVFPSLVEKLVPVP